MKKLLVLIVAALLLAPVSAMAGMNAFMDMDELSNSELASTTGQTGITINATAQILGGYIAWGDNDGCGGTTAATDGWLTINGITASGIVLDGTTIDVCTAGTTTWLTIGVPALTINANVASLYLGSTIRTNGPDSLGQLTIGNLQLAAMTLEITGHP
ncbi:MAG: DUF6160 family protein [Thermodesulfobacteriota bacterium]